MKRKHITALALGIYFGIVLVKGQVISWFEIQKMFRFESAYMYLVITSAIVVGIISVFIIKKTGTTAVDGEEIEIRSKPFNTGVVIGSLLFGMGWAITGACPGPIYAQIGSGTLLAIVTFVSALGGAYLYGIARPKLPH